MHQQSQNQKQRVLVNVILDKSGSMASKLNDVIEGFNAYVDGLAKEEKVDYLFSLTLFDTVVAYRDVAIPLSSVNNAGDIRLSQSIARGPAGDLIGHNLDLNRQ